MHAKLEISAYSTSLMPGPLGQWSGNKTNVLFTIIDKSTIHMQVEIWVKLVSSRVFCEVVAKMNPLSPSGSVLIKTTLMKHWQRHIVVHPDRVLVKTSLEYEQ